MLIYRHPLTLQDSIGEATVRLAERVRESIHAPSWNSACSCAFATRDSLLENAPTNTVPFLLDTIAAAITPDPAL